MPVAHFLLGCLFLNDLLSFCCLLLLCLYTVSVCGASQAPLPVSVARCGAWVSSRVSGSGAWNPLPLCPDGLLPLQRELGGPPAETLACLLTGFRLMQRELGGPPAETLACLLTGFRLTPEHSVSSCQPRALLGSLKQVLRLALSSCLLICMLSPASCIAVEVRPQVL